MAGKAICFFGVVTPVFCPVVVPSLRGNCTLRVSRQSSVTQPSSRLLTENKQNNYIRFFTRSIPISLTVHIMHIIHVLSQYIANADDLGQWPIVRSLHPDRQTTSLRQRTLPKQKVNKNINKVHPKCFVYRKSKRRSHFWGYVQWICFRYIMIFAKRRRPNGLGSPEIVQKLTVDSQKGITSSSNSIFGCKINKMYSFWWLSEWNHDKRAMFGQTPIKLMQCCSLLLSDCDV